VEHPKLLTQTRINFHHFTIDASARNKNLRLAGAGIHRNVKGIKDKI
jgi:hypothetical protein